MFYIMKVATNGTIKSVVKRTTLNEILLSNGIVLNDELYNKLNDTIFNNSSLDDLTYINDFFLKNDINIYNYLIDNKINIRIIYLNVVTPVIAYQDSSKTIFVSIKEENIDPFIKDHKLKDYFVCY